MFYDYASLLLPVQAAGASAAVVIQTAPAWPYTMTDGAGETAGGQLHIPVVMLRQVSGLQLTGSSNASA